MGDGLLLGHFGRMTDEELAAHDVAALNLNAAVGLPGAEDMPIRVMLDILDRVAELVECRTRERWHYFDDDPAKFRHSPNFFRAVVMAEVLQRDLQMRYNPARAPDPDAPGPKKRTLWKDSRDLFIHGLISGNGGTCTSLPVLYLAIGRRLGYPLYLVHVGTHYFVRWEDPDGSECFNIEATAYGLNSYDDEYYRKKNQTLSPPGATGVYGLPSLSPRQEMAAFLCARADCLRDNAVLGRAVAFYHHAVRLDPTDVYSEVFFLACLKLWDPKVLPAYLPRTTDVAMRAEPNDYIGTPTPPTIVASANQELLQLTTG